MSVRAVGVVGVGIYGCRKIKSYERMNICSGVAVSHDTETMGLNFRRFMDLCYGVLAILASISGLFNFTVASLCNKGLPAAALVSVRPRQLSLREPNHRLNYSIRLSSCPQVTSEVKETNQRLVLFSLIVD